MEQSRAAAIAEFALEEGLEAVLGAAVHCFILHQVVPVSESTLSYSMSTFLYIQG